VVAATRRRRAVCSVVASPRHVVGDAMSGADIGVALGISEAEADANALKNAGLLGAAVAPAK
jgi:hypothetical protein